jgi:multiple sugar transport system substrate-binding protein
LNATYDDPDVRDALPFAAELKQAVQQAKPRPVTPLYPRVSEAIYSNVNTAPSGSLSPEAAIRQADEEIGNALDTF